MVALIVLLLILAIFGGLGFAAHFLWFVLIALSAVLTYQHHILDVVGGFALGAYCLYFFPDSSTPHLPSVGNRRVAFYYSITADVPARLRRGERN